MLQWQHRSPLRFLLQPIGTFLVVEFGVLRISMDLIFLIRKRTTDKKRTIDRRGERVHLCTRSGFHAPTTKKLRNQYNQPCAVLAFLRFGRAAATSGL
jgi:hypothetical protein